MYVTTMQTIKRSLKMLIFFTVILGIIYPAVLVLVGNILFPSKVNGSLLHVNGKIIGSELIGQYFTDPKYFCGRPSATQPMPYNALASGASNLAPSNPLLQKQVTERINQLQAANPNAAHQITLDLLTTSASGLDPLISLRSVYYQLHRVAAARKMNSSVIEYIIRSQASYNILDIYAMKTVNVLHLNRELDRIQAAGKGNDRQTN